MQGMATGFTHVHSDISVWVIPIGALALLIGGLAAAAHYRFLMQYWLSGLLAIGAAAASLPVATAVYGYFHGGGGGGGISLLP